VILAGVVLIHIAFVLYTIFIIKESKYGRATQGVVGFITAAVLFDISATSAMMIGTEKEYFTTHGILGYTALCLMIVDAIYIWKHRLAHGPDVPFSDRLNRNSKLAYVLWLIAFGTGEYIAFMAK
jgi:sterol desaturase/sphingolipid hydroxylase (fatty acid hydroxylase superfamily)